MEHTLGALLPFKSNKLPATRLNPCSNGTYSRRRRFTRDQSFSTVLILVLMEHTLGAHSHFSLHLPVSMS